MLQRNRAFRSPALICYVILATCLALVSCIQKPNPPIRIGSNIWLGYEPMYLARDLSLFDEGRIQLNELTSTSETLHELINGNIEAAALTMDEALNAISKGIPLEIALIFDISNGADALVAKQEVSSLADLVGKKLVVEENAVGAIMYYSILDKLGVDDNAVQTVNVSADRHVSIWQKGDISGIITFEPSLTNLLRQGGHILFDSSEIPERIIDVLAVRKDLSRDHQTSLKAFIASYFQALSYLKNSSGKGANYAILRHRLKLNPEEIRRSLRKMIQPDLDGNLRLLSGVKPPIIDKTERIITFLRQHGLLKGPISTRDLFTDKYLNGNTLAHP